MNRSQRLLVGLVTIVAVVLGTSALTAPSASASDPYGTNFAESCGLEIPYGPYCQIVFTKQLSEQMKSKMVAGETIASVANFACGKIPGWITAAACVGLLTYNTATTRDAVNAAHANSNKCVAVRFYSSSLGNVGNKHVSAVTCNFGIQCCSGGSGGGGGGGGGGSWRQEMRHATMGSDMKVTAGSGGGSW